MKVTVKTKVNLNTKLISELEGKAKNNALYNTAVWVLGEIISSAKVPKDTNTLELSGYPTIYSDIANKTVYGAVIFDTPYTRRWYFNTEGAKFNQDKNPNAQDHWMDDFIYGDRKQELIEMYATFYREEIGGLLK